MKHIHRLLVIAFFFIGLTSVSASVSDDHEQEIHQENHVAKKFEPGNFIMDHVVDAYDWHVFSYGDFHFTAPLPIIVYSENSGFHIFMSSEFNHGHSSFKGFELAKEGEYRGKVVEMIDGRQVRPFDISMTKNVVAMLFSMIFLLWLFVSISKTYRLRKGQEPKGIQAFLEPIIVFVIDDIAKSAIGEKKYKKFVPFLLTIFFFIWLNNMMGIVPFIPGGANVTGNITITLVLALFTFVITTINSNKHYWKDIFNTPGVPWWLKFPIPLMPFVELMGVFTKPFVLMIRLFANITAGHMIVMAFISLIFIFGEISPLLGMGTSVVSVLFIIFMDILELLVALIQAYVFTLLSALYFGMAVEEEH
ncbi:F0F1 ATP synthase subunit A [Ancylomarina sp. 16SWW S1-10-2]|uniref:F0F1 ATP synthase subunit A n=1 Tax=Ancylomarina sp. 16SWW S1-10-2 TaxID=2499681 RepID=UPI0012ADC857|nr:F0F1 ATP synthase subunit A [Ancylomarina sp. 16SWW S1-10-2]MRT92155.1 ATP synthase F0 subunit A [Ancylomarina sp. 16SWW S1-10-2]